VRRLLLAFIVFRKPYSGNPVGPLLKLLSMVLFFLHIDISIFLFVVFVPLKPTLDPSHNLFLYLSYSFALWWVDFS